MMAHCQLDPEEHVSMKYYLKLKKKIIQECAFENIVCEIAAILYQPQRVNCGYQLVAPEN